MGSLIERGANIITWIEKSVNPCLQCGNRPHVFQAMIEYRTCLELLCNCEEQQGMKSDPIFPPDFIESARDLVQRWNAANEGKP